MFDRAWGRIGRARRVRCSAAEDQPRRGLRPAVRAAGRPRQLLAASLAPDRRRLGPRSYLGFQVPLDGGAGDARRRTRVTLGQPERQGDRRPGQVPDDQRHATPSSGAERRRLHGPGDVPALRRPDAADDLDGSSSSSTQGFYTGQELPPDRPPASPAPTDFIVQGGSVNGNGTGDVNQPGFPFADEFDQQLAFTGHRPAGDGQRGRRHQRLAVLHHHRIAPVPRLPAHDLRPARLGRDIAHPDDPGVAREQRPTRPTSSPILITRRPSPTSTPTA